MIDFRKDVWNHYLLPVGTHGLTISVKKDKVIDTDIVIKDNEQGAHAQPFPTWKDGMQLWWQHHAIKDNKTKADGQGGPGGSSTDGNAATTDAKTADKKTAGKNDEVGNTNMDVSENIDKKE